jgi:hypothetical protein
MFDPPLPPAEATAMAQIAFAADAPRGDAAVEGDRADYPFPRPL